MSPSAFSSGDMRPLPLIKSISHLRKDIEQHFGKISSQDTEALVG